MSDYNYSSFSSNDYEFNISTGPSVGDKAPDFMLATSDGTQKRILDFGGDFLVLEMGSITCPLFQSRRKTMHKIETDTPNISSAILYVREAHPGADIPEHKGIEDKHACAERLRQEDGETRMVLVDDFKGTAHKAYGSMPNSVFIINQHGCVVFKAEWNNASATRKAIKALSEGRMVRSKSYFLPAVPSTAIHTLGRAGKGSAFDFLKSLPFLIWHNLIMRNLRLFFNKPAPSAHDLRC